MSYRPSKKQGRWQRRPAKTQRITTGLGYLYNVLRFFNATRLTKLLMRKPWHVADIYVDGHFSHPVKVAPKWLQERSVRKMLERAYKAAEQRSRGVQTTGTQTTPLNSFGRLRWNKRTGDQFAKR
jgi:hypothetical protein